MAVGNTFGATALSSYGGFWIAFGIILTPGGFNIVTALGGHSAAGFLDSFGLFLMVSIPASMEHITIANDALGLVHFHLHSPPLHSEIHRRLFLAILHAHNGVLVAWNWIS